MGYDDNPYKELEDAVRKSVDSMYEGLSSYYCDNCKSFYIGDSSECQNCGSWSGNKC